MPARNEFATSRANWGRDEGPDAKSQGQGASCPSHTWRITILYWRPPGPRIRGAFALSHTQRISKYLFGPI